MSTAPSFPPERAPRSTSSSEDAEKKAYQEAGEGEKLTAIQRAEREGKTILKEDDCYDILGYSYSSMKKWTIMTIIFIVQVSMNFNTSLYSNNLTNIENKFSISAQAARCGAMIFLVLYAFGCELWAPWSEELGRKPILQASLMLVNIWQILAGLAPNFGALMAARALGGLSSAGGSVTLGMIADVFEPNDQQYAVAYIVLSSVGGSILGPIIGAFTEAYLGYAWNFWVQLIFGGFTQIVHFIFVPETRSTILLDREAKRRRKNGETNVYGPNEVTPFKERFSAKEIGIIWIRPFHMFLTEPIVLFLSLLSGFSDALIFMFLQSFTLIYTNIYGFGTIATNMAFAPILIGYILAWLSFIPFIRKNIRDRARYPDNERIQYESRLYWLLYTAPCLWIGLFGFAWTTQPQVPFIASMIFAAVIGIANYSIYMATIDYMICAYGPYSASATGGNGFSRDFLAGVLTLPATPFFENIGPDHHVNYALTILACIAFLVTVPVYIFYFKGEWFRKRSPFAQSLHAERVQNEDRRMSSIAQVSERRASMASQSSGKSRSKSKDENAGGERGF